MKQPKQKSPGLIVVERLIKGIGSITSLVIHTILFVASFAVVLFHLIDFATMLLVLTTALSLEAIYLAIFIQMTVNQNTESLREVEEDIDEIQEDVEELNEDIDEMQEDLEELGEDIEELSEEDKEDEKREKEQAVTLEQLTANVRQILEDLEGLKKRK
jgi:septal ring factor EnvC (AmiA/AmiB activator)